MKFKKVTHVIYDLDGLLLDTEPLHTLMIETIVSRYGKVFERSMQSKFAGRNALDSAQILVEMLALPITAQAFLEEREAFLERLLPQAKPLPGAVRLTQHLHHHQIPQAVATSSGSRTFGLKTTHYQEWFALFDCIVLGDDPALKRGKPAPDIFLLAAQRLGASPEECLVFEDAHAGMEAALAAGMSVVVVPDSGVDKQLYREANQILNSLNDFDPQLWQLPSWQ
ncbi:MAG: HAD-IA family hydrolase [Cyanobacteriota bacterium]|nr:HAD-IA family hydrolase [Cyanobacteriota bacterium]